MNKGVFEEIILTHQLTLERSKKLYDLGVDLMHFEEPYIKIINNLMAEHFNQEQIGWIDWFLYERNTFSGEILKAHRTTEDGKQEEICYDIDSLWDVVCEAANKKNTKSKNK
jgi:hypothetical protein